MAVSPLALRVHPGVRRRLLPADGPDRGHAAAQTRPAAAGPGVGNAALPDRLAVGPAGRPVPPRRILGLPPLRPRLRDLRLPDRRADPIAPQQRGPGARPARRPPAV